MRIRIIRLRKEYRLKFWISFALIAIMLFFLSSSNRSAIITFFSSQCRNYPQASFSRMLNDRLPAYHDEAIRTGIVLCNDEGDIRNRALTGKLRRVRSSGDFIIEDMTYSYPYLTKSGRKLLRVIGDRFDEKISREGLKGSRFIVTSMTRTSENLRKLGGRNSNASENSPHLTGNAFDISYARFSFLKLHVTECDKWYLKEALAEVLYELRKEKKCWVTYERKQGCFHVVTR